MGLLLDFGFRREGVDVIYACVDAENVRSRRMFESLGFRDTAGVDDSAGVAADDDLDLALRRADHAAARLHG